MTPATAAIFVFTKIFAIESASVIVPMASCDAPLKPNQPSQRIKTPSVASGIFDPGMGLTLPSTYLPLRAPRMIAPISAAESPFAIKIAAAPFPRAYDGVNDTR